MERYISKKRIAIAMTFLMFIASNRLPLASAAGRKGSMVVVTMTDGRVVKGELLAIKADALLVHDQDAGQGKSIDLRQVARVKLFKKGKFLPWLAIGVGVGLGIGFFQYEKTDKVGMAGLSIVAQIPLAGLCGGILGAFAGLHEKFSLAGASSWNVRKNLERLKRYSRERDDETLAAPNLESNRRHYLRHRLRLLWMPWSQHSSGSTDFGANSGTFRFVNDSPEADAVIYPFKPDVKPDLLAPHFRIGQLRLEYEWTHHYSASLEFVASGKLDSSMRNDLSYFSTDLAKRVESVQTIHNKYSYSSLLLGLNWKPFSPSFVSKHIVELGVAAGWVQARMNPDNQYGYNLNPAFKIKTSAWMAKAHFAYDYYYNDSVSLGGGVEFQRLTVQFPSVKYVKNLEFGPPKIYDREFQIMRRTEITIPSHKMHLGGLAYGIRVGMRF